MTSTTHHTESNPGAPGALCGVRAQCQGVVADGGYCPRCRDDAATSARRRPDCADASDRGGQDPIPSRSRGQSNVATKQGAMGSGPIASWPRWGSRISSWIPRALRCRAVRSTPKRIGSMATSCSGCSSASGVASARWGRWSRPRPQPSRTSDMRIGRGPCCKSSARAIALGCMAD